MVPEHQPALAVQAQRNPRQRLPAEREIAEDPDAVVAPDGRVPVPDEVLVVRFDRFVRPQRCFELDDAPVPEVGVGDDEAGHGAVPAGAGTAPGRCLGCCQVGWLGPSCSRPAVATAAARRVPRSGASRAAPLRSASRCRSSRRSRIAGSSVAR